MQSLKKLFNFTNNGKRNTLRKILMLPMKHNITYGIVKIDTKETINLLNIAYIKALAHKNFITEIRGGKKNGKWTTAAYFYKDASPEFIEGVKAFCEKALYELACSSQISVTTFREGDKADTGYREIWGSLGFAEAELLVEFGYPTQRFVLQKEKAEEKEDE